MVEALLSLQEAEPEHYSEDIIRGIILRPCWECSWIFKINTYSSIRPYCCFLLLFFSLVVMDNGLVQVTLLKPEGIVTSIRYNGTDNLLEIREDEEHRGYWDLNWNGRHKVGLDGIKGTSFNVILQNEKQVEVSFTRTWNSSLNSSLTPLNIDKRFIMLQESHGFYSYAIFEHLNGWPDLSLHETRIVFRLTKDKFHYMAVSDTRQRRMPLPDDRLEERCQPLAYPEAVRLINPIELEFTGEVDDKYQYSCTNEENRVHGWISTDPPVGFWQITPSDEFRSGGPLMQDLTSHVGPTSLVKFITSHYRGPDVIPIFRNGEPWKKVFGPVFIYLNSGPAGTDEKTLWQDAKLQMLSEVQRWPYSFPASEDFAKSEQRGSVIGRLLIRDRYINKEDISAGFAYIGVALPGEVGSWQRECKGYQFWTRAGPDGSFSINNIRVGEYNLYAWVPGFIGDYKYDSVITINPGGKIDLGVLLYDHPRDGPTLWEIGIPDRSAAEFFIPDPSPDYVNPLYIDQDRFRQYGLWETYSSLYPKEDLVYIVGVSDYRKDWFFAHVTRKVCEGAYQATTWQIIFKLEKVGEGGTYKLRLALASANDAELQVRFNDMNVNPPHFSTQVIGKDNAIARHGIHGIYWLFNIDVKSNWLIEGNNTIFLTQTRSLSPFQGVMYDCIRLEGPPYSSLKSKI